MSLRTQYKELSKDQKAKLETEVTGFDPIQSLLEGPSVPDIDAPDLAGEVRSRVEQQKAKIASSPKMFPMYYERANKGKFITVKTKIGKTKKTKLL